MARRKELKNCNIGVQDGFSGTGAVDDASISASDTTIGVDTLVLHDDVTVVPVGARFTTEGILTIRTVTASNNSMVWLITVDASSGNFTITFEGQTTASIAEGATAGAVQTALEALSNVAPGDLVVTGSAGGPFTVTAAATYANTDGLTLTVADVDLMGGTGVSRTVEQDGTTTWQLTFTPAIATGSVPADDDVITFLPQRVTARVGSGTIDWTESDEPIFDLDRGFLADVRSGDEQPMQVNFSFVFDWLRASSGDPITIYEALHRIGGAAGWHSASDDPCQPYCVEVFIEDIPPCGSEQAEVMIFPQFYKTSVNPTFEDALVSISGQCNATRPTITRVNANTLESEQ